MYYTHKVFNVLYDSEKNKLIYKTDNMIYIMKIINLFYGKIERNIKNIIDTTKIDKDKIINELELISIKEYFYNVREKIDNNFEICHDELFYPNSLWKTIKMPIILKLFSKDNSYQYKPKNKTYQILIQNLMRTKDNITNLLTFKIAFINYYLMGLIDDNINEAEKIINEIKKDNENHEDFIKKINNVVYNSNIFIKIFKLIFLFEKLYNQ